MRVRSDLDRNAQLLCLPAVAPVEIEPMRIGVELNGDPEVCRFLQNRLHIDRVRLARQEQSTGWMREDRKMGIVQRGQHPFRHRISIHAESRMDRPDHVVEAVEYLSGVVEGSARRSVRFLEDAKPFIRS